MALPRLEVAHPLKWSQCAITFNSADQLKCAATAGALPMLCSPVISNVQVTKTLIDGGAGLNVLSVNMLPIEHCVGFPRRGRDDATK